MLLGFLLLGGGVLLVNGGIKGVHPWQPVADVLAPGTSLPEPGSGAVAAAATITHTPGPPATAPIAQPGTTPRGASAIGAQVAAAAQRYLGSGYSPDGHSIGSCIPGRFMDCSCLSMTAWASVGVTLPHNAAAQYAICRKLGVGMTPPPAAGPGALIFMPLGETHISHVAIYLGGNQTIESAPSHGGVGFAPLGYQRGPYFWGVPHHA